MNFLLITVVSFVVSAALYDARINEEFMGMHGLIWFFTMIPAAIQLIFSRKMWRESGAAESICRPKSPADSVDWPDMLDVTNPQSPAFHVMHLDR